MIRVYDNEDKEYGEFETIELAYAAIKVYLNENNIISHYWRYNVTDNHTLNIDYGSHYHFFNIQNTETENLFDDIMNIHNPNPHVIKEDTLNDLRWNEYKEEDIKLEEFKEKSEPKRFSLRTIENVAKLIDSLSDKNGSYTFHVTIDEFQSLQKPDNRWYTVEVADFSNGERFIYDSEEDW
jgi:hypothetical protein